MTLPEDVREKVAFIVDGHALYCNGEGLVTGNLAIRQLIDLLTSAKAEGYQEGVKAMREAVKAEVFSSLEITTDGMGNIVDQCADQLLNDPNTTP